MAALLKTSLFLGLVLFLGAGVFARFIGPEAQPAAVRRRLRIGFLAGAGLVLAASLADLAWVLRQVLGLVTAELYLDFLLRTRQGVSVAIRLLLLAAMVALGLGRRSWLRLDRVLFVAAALALLATVSRVSHSGALGPLPLLGDLAHMVAATSWGGALLYLAWLPLWQASVAPLGTVVARVSAVGLAGVSLLIVSGIYASTLHLFGVAAFTQTAYGGTLAFKLGLVAVIVVLAAVNRFALVPAVVAAPARPEGLLASLGRLVRVESIVLVAVFAVTGVLGTRVPAYGSDHLDHGLDGLSGLHEDHEDEDLAAFASGPIVVQLTSDPETAVVLLVVRLQQDGEPVEGATVRLLEASATEGGAQEMAPVGWQPGVYGTPTFVAPEFGDWRVTVGIEYPDGQRVVEELPVLPFASP